MATKEVSLSKVLVLVQGSMARLEGGVPLQHSCCEDRKRTRGRELGCSQAFQVAAAEFESTVVADTWITAET